MPVKVKCRECGTPAVAPDAARGKAIKCKECGKPIRIPSGEGGEAPKKKAAPKKEATIEDEDFFSKLDLDDVEHADKRICPKCAAQVTDEDIECPECGVNLETGQLSDRQKKKRKILKIQQGRDPDLFFKVGVKEAVEFLKENWGLAFRLAAIVALASTISSLSLFVTIWFEKVPLKLFFGLIYMMASLAGYGVGFQMLVTCVQRTMDGHKDMGRFNFDFFSGVALGLKLIIWPYVLTGPVLIPAGAIVAVAVLLGAAFAGGEGAIVAGGATAAFFFLAGSIALPVALSHMSAKYTYKAYLPWEMARISWKNIKAVAYWWAITIAFELPFVILAVLVAVFFPNVNEGMSKTLEWIYGLMGFTLEKDGESFTYRALFPIIWFVVLYPTYFIFSLLMAIPYVLIARLTGSFCYYNQSTLEMGDKRVAGQSVGFWVRYLGFLIDSAVLGCFNVCVFILFLGLMWLTMEIGLDDFVPQIALLLQFVQFLLPAGYFVLSESGPGGATLGMSALGMQVVNMEGKKPITRSQAITRYIGRVVGGGLFSFGYLMCAYDKEKQTLHDKISKTRVVWRPEH